MTLTVHPYRRRLVAATVTGFTVGPINPGAHTECSSRGELHGNWELLRLYLQTTAPNCHPSLQQTLLGNGVGAVDFVLEDTHRHELLALNGTTAPGLRHHPAHSG